MVWASWENPMKDLNMNRTHLERENWNERKEMKKIRNGK